MSSRLVPPAIRRNFNIDLSASLLIGLFIAACINYIPVVARRLGATETELAIIVSVPLAGSLLTPLAVYLRPQRRFPALIIIWTIARSVFLLTVFVTQPTPFVIIVVIFYILMAIPTPVYVEVMGAIYPVTLRGRAMSYVRAGMMGVVALATPIAGWLMDQVGYAVLFAFGALAAIAATAVFSRIRAGAFQSQRTSFAAVFRILGRDRMFSIFSLGLMFMGIGYLAGAPLFAIVQVDELHLSYADVGLLNLLSSLTWMSFSVVMGRLLDRRGALTVMLVANVTQAMISLCYFLAHSVVLVAAAFFFAGVSAAAGELAWLSCILLFAGANNVAEYSALHAVLVGTRGIIGPLVGTILITVVGISLQQTLFISFLLQVVGVGVMLWVTRTYRSAPSRVSTSAGDKQGRPALR